MVNNKSRTFLLPLLSELVGFEKRFHKNIVNTYIEFSCGNYDNCIGILQDFSFKNPDYTSYEHRFIKNSLFRELKDIEDNQVLYIFDFPEEYLHEYNCYKKGQYSKFGIDAKELILEYFAHVYKDNMNAIPFLMKTKQVLFKDQKLKRQMEKKLVVKIEDSAELAGVPNLEAEMFDTLKYKTNENKEKQIDNNIFDSKE